MIATFIDGKPIMQAATPTDAWSAGDVVLIGSTPFVAHNDNPLFGTDPIEDALAVRGGIYEIATDGTPVIGEDVFFNSTSKKLTATSQANVHFGILLAGPSGDLFGAGPAADGDLGYALHAPNGNSSSEFAKKSEVTQSTTATLTAAQLLAGFINSAPAAGITLTLPSAANMVAGVVGAKVGDSFSVMIENTSGGANAITLAAGGATLRGGTSIAQNKAATLKILLTNVGSGTEAYTVYSQIGA